MNPLIIKSPIKTRFRIDANVRVSLDKFGTYRSGETITIDGSEIPAGLEIATTHNEEGKFFVSVRDVATKEIRREYVSETFPIVMSAKPVVLEYTGVTEKVYDGTQTIRLDLTNL